MKFSELKPGQEFVTETEPPIKGIKTPLGYISLKDGLTNYDMPPDTPVSLLTEETP